MASNGDRHADGGAQRFEYELVPYGDTWVPVTGPDYDTLEEAIEDYASKGWRFVQAIDNNAIFERPTDD